jgi:hypothetical protein
VLEKTPGAVQARYGRFYASVEMEDFATAHAVIDSLVADQPVWRGYKDEPTSARPGCTANGSSPNARVKTQ